MKKDFKRKVANVAGVTPSIVEAIYQEISHDSLALSNPLMNQRIQVALQGEPGIIVDLCTLNSGRPGDNFDEFFSKMEEAVNEVTAADESRHGTAHLSQWLSWEDLIEQVKSKWNQGAQQRPCETAICTNESLHQSALNFTSRFEQDPAKTAPSISPWCILLCCTLQVIASTHVSAAFRNICLIHGR